MLTVRTVTTGLTIQYQDELLPYHNATLPLVEKLDSHRGALFISSFEFPGRYTCWDLGFYNPPIALVCHDNRVNIQALNLRGEVILHALEGEFSSHACINLIEKSSTKLCLAVPAVTGNFSEEERSQQPSIFTILRCLLAFFKVTDEPYLGIYGAFGYDLIFQFEQLQRQKLRDPSQRDMVLYLPDEIWIVNHRKEEAFIRRYEFDYQGESTSGLSRSGDVVPYYSKNSPLIEGDFAPNEYSLLVEFAKQSFARGDLFEVVPSQTFYHQCQLTPGEVFRKMRKVNPSPYGFLINLGDEEYLVGASPEMYVRVTGRRVETCPISGTIKRGGDAIEDAKQIEQLLFSEKEASELTMCTDVDRNDKSRICEAGSVKVIGRRQIEMYSRLIHTVDHVEGMLREGFDAVDAFLSHMWVVTVTGAPKLWAMDFIEKNEKSPRRWYAGAIGWFGFDGNLNTGLILRTLRIEKGIAEIRAGATLLFDSDPVSEEAETRLKASAFIDLLKDNPIPTQIDIPNVESGRGKKVLLVDHQDSFVHTLANYIRQTKAQVTTVRFDKVGDYLQKEAFDLVLLSPGPGCPDDFLLKNTIDAVLVKKIPLFGVCLGLQGIVEYFGGSLSRLSYPMHGKASVIEVKNNALLFKGLGHSFTAGRYHSLYANPEDFPEQLSVTAISEDGIIMAVSHRTLLIQAVQFHPETILSMPNQAGQMIINNLMAWV